MCRMKKLLLITTFAILLSLAGVIAEAQCMPYGTVNWNLEDSYAINSPITFTPQIISSQDLQGKSVVIKLLEKDTFTGEFEAIDQKTGLNVLSNNYLSEVNFPFGTGESIIKFELIIDDSISFISQEVEIEESMIVTISAGGQITNTGGEISIPISIEKLGGGLVPNPTVTVTIKKGVNDFIQPTLVSSSQIKFKTDHLDWIQLKVEADAEGYAHAESETSFQLIFANAVPKINVGGIDYETLDEGRISIGTKTILIKIDVGGIPTKIDKVELFMNTPDGEFDQLNFNAVNSAKTEWKTSYNFLSSDLTYTMGGNPNAGIIGTASNFDTGKGYPISVIFNTLGGGDYCDTHPEDPICKPPIPWWIWIIVAVVILLIIGGIVIAVIKR